MKVNPINNNQTSFGAIKFRNKKSQKRFMSELKKLPLKEFNKALNVIKNQEDNFVPIMIANHNGMNEFDKGLKLRATIADGIVDAQNSLTEFLEECAKWADYHKLQYNYQEIINGEKSERIIKDNMYINALAGLSKTDLPKTLY